MRLEDSKLIIIKKNNLEKYKFETIPTVMPTNKRYLRLRPGVGKYQLVDYFLLQINIAIKLFLLHLFCFVSQIAIFRQWDLDL